MTLRSIKMLVGIMVSVSGDRVEFPSTTPLIIHTQHTVCNILVCRIPGREKGEMNCDFVSNNCLLILIPTKSCDRGNAENWAVRSRNKLFVILGNTKIDSNSISSQFPSGISHFIDYQSLDPTCKSQGGHVPGTAPHWGHLGTPPPPSIQGWRLPPFF